MTRKEVIVRAIDGRLTWIAAAEILGITPRRARRATIAAERQHGCEAAHSYFTTSGVSGPIPGWCAFLPARVAAPTFGL